MKHRLSRPCYDKAHRCPGWAGGGTRSASKYRCEGGRILTRKPYPDFPGEYEYPGSAQWRFGHCVGSIHKGTPSCGVVTWPYALRWLDWRYVINWKLRPAIRDLFRRSR